MGRAPTDPRQYQTTVPCSVSPEDLPGNTLCYKLRGYVERVRGNRLVYLKGLFLVSFVQTRVNSSRPSVVFRIVSRVHCGKELQPEVFHERTVSPRVTSPDFGWFV